MVFGNSASGFGGGGGINGGPVNLNGSTVSGNSASGTGGGINGGTVTLTNSTVSGNSASGWGGGIFSDSGTVTLTNSTVSGNSSADNGGGIVVEDATVTLTNSTVSGNSAKGAGGIHNYGGTATLTNSTVSGNSASSSGGGIYASYTDTVGETTLAYSTVSGNDGGGIHSGISSTITLSDSIVANNTGGNCVGSIADGGNNLADDATCGMAFDALTAFDTNLADNGGPTRTHALLAGNSAIDAAGTCDLATDQRGALRPAGSCDSGAFEFIPCPDLVLSDDTILGTETRENCQKVLVGPNFAVAGSGDLSLGAGKSVTFRNGTSVETDGQLTIDIAPDLQLVPPPP
jgi:predicted outer membrane repeat protein